MLVSPHFPFGCQPFEGFSLKGDGVVTGGNEVEHFGLTYKEADIDPIAVAFGLLAERAYLIGVGVDVDCSEFSFRLIHAHGDEALALTVFFYRTTDVDVGHSVTIGEQEGFVTDKRFYPLQPAAGECVQSGIYQGDAPVF